MGEFKSVSYAGSYLPIEDHGLIGDGSTAAVAGRQTKFMFRYVKPKSE
jgi:hypothetical protein